MEGGSRCTGQCVLICAFEAGLHVRWSEQARGGKSVWHCARDGEEDGCGIRNRRDIGDASHRNARNLAPFTDGSSTVSLEEDRPVHRKQHHTAKRIFERLRDEHGFTGKETILKDYVRARNSLRRRSDVCAVVPSSGPCSSGLWRGGCDHRRRQVSGAFFRHDTSVAHSDACFVAALLPRRRRRRPSWTGTTEPLFFSAAFPNRFFTTTTSVWCRASCQMARGNERGRSWAAVPLPLRGPLRPSRQG